MYKYPFPIYQRGLMTAVSLCVTFGDHIPVDNIPPSGEIIRATILIFEVVGMFPHIVAENREVAVRERIILVGSASDGQIAGLVEDQPSPTRAKAFHASIVERSLESIK